MEGTKKCAGWFSGKYHDDRMSDALAYFIRLTVLMVVLLGVFHLDNSGFLAQLAKWPRRAAILAGFLATAELLYFTVIKTLLCILKK